MAEKENDNAEIEGGDYRTVPVDQTSHPRFAGLSPDAKLLWFLMRTSRHHKRTGLFLFPMGEFLRLMFPVSGPFDQPSEEDALKMKNAFEELEKSRWIETETLDDNPGSVFVFMTAPEEASGKAWRPATNAPHRKNVETDMAQYKELRLANRVFESLGLTVPEEVPEEVLVGGPRGGPGRHRDGAETIRADPSGARMERRAREENKKSHPIPSHDPDVLSPADSDISHGRCATDISIPSQTEEETDWDDPKNWKDEDDAEIIDVSAKVRADREQAKAEARERKDEEIRLAYEDEPPTSLSPCDGGSGDE